jgi:hypothetical protein
MDKIFFHIQEKSKSTDVQEILENSFRIYSHLKISQNAQLPILETLKTHLTNLTSISIHKTDFENFDDFLNFTSQFEKTIREIHLEQVYIKVLKKKSQKFKMDFPKLISLNATCCQASIFNEVFSECKNLNKFVIKSGDQISTFAQRAVLKILEQNLNLKILGVHFNVFNLIFLEDVAMDFKLEEFCARDLSRIVGNQLTIARNFHIFLLQQFDTLQVLSISNWLGIEVFELIFHVPNLRKLTLQGFHNCEATIEWDDIELRGNETVEILNFSDMSKNFKILKVVINAVKNIKELSVYSMNDAERDFVNATCSKLTKINVEK